MGDPLAAVAGYLQSHFPAAQVERDGSQFKIAAGPSTYTLSVADDALAPGEDVVERLVSSNLADELCRAEGLPLVLTRAGIRLKSSN